MNRRMLGLGVLFILAVVGLWVWITDDPEIGNQKIALPTIVEAGTARAQAAMEAADRSNGDVRLAVEPELPTPATKGALVKVLVVDAANHQPVVGAAVRAMFDDGVRGHSFERTQRSRGKPFEILLSDQDGRVEIEIPPGVPSSVDTYSVDDSSGHASVDVPPLEEDAIHDVLLAVPVGRDMPFWLKLVDAETRHPLPGVRVSETQGDEASQPCTSDESGLALFQARSWQQSNLRIEAEGRSKHYIVT